VGGEFVDNSSTVSATPFSWTPFYDRAIADAVGLGRPERKNLTAIYVTTGTAIISSALHRFWSASRAPRRSATPEIVNAMREQLSPASIDTSGRRLFPGEIPEPPASRRAARRQ